MAKMRQAEAFKRHKSRLNASQKRFLYCFGIPTFLLYLYICILPVIESVANGFTKWNGYSEKNWVGLSNYIKILKDPVFYQALRNDLYLVCIKEVLIVILALAFAVSLTRVRLHKRERLFLRFVYYIPNMLSVIVISMLWRFVFNLGLFDEFLALLHIDFHSQNGWMTDYPLQIVGVVASWCGIGSYMIILIAAINNVSREVYEAAEIDGAGQFVQLFKITVPAVMSQIRYVIVTILTSSLAGNLNLVLPFTNGGPGTRSMVMGLYVYQEAYTNYEVGYADAAAVLLMLISVCLASLVNGIILKKGEDR